MQLWREYLNRKAFIRSDHPYAWISFEKQQLGMPYTISAFSRNYENGLRRIGLEKNQAEGLSQHSHRHSYGHRLSDANIRPIYIKRFMHHANLESQLVYTEPEFKRANAQLNKATKQFKAQKDNNSKTKSLLLEYGYEDIDPNGLYSGILPVF